MIYADVLRVEREKKRKAEAKKNRRRALIVRRARALGLAEGGEDGRAAALVRADVVAEVADEEIAPEERVNAPEPESLLDDPDAP